MNKLKIALASVLLVTSLIAFQPLQAQRADSTYSRQDATMDHDHDNGSGWGYAGLLGLVGLLGLTRRDKDRDRKTVDRNTGFNRP